MKPKKYLKTNVGYFTVYGWDFRIDFPASCALPFPNRLGITISKAKTWLKEHGVAFFVETADYS